MQPKDGPCIRNQSTSWWPQLPALALLTLLAGCESVLCGLGLVLSGFLCIPKSAIFSVIKLSMSSLRSWTDIGPDTRPRVPKYATGATREDSWYQRWLAQHHQHAVDVFFLGLGCWWLDSSHSKIFFFLLNVMSSKISVSGHQNFFRIIFNSKNKVLELYTKNIYIFELKVLVLGTNRGTILHNCRY